MPAARKFTPSRPTIWICGSGVDFSHQGGSSLSGFYLGKVDPIFGQNGFAGYSFTPTGFSPKQGLFDPASQALLASRFVSQVGRAGRGRRRRPVQ